MAGGAEESSNSPQGLRDGYETLPEDEEVTIDFTMEPTGPTQHPLSSFSATRGEPTPAAGADLSKFDPFSPNNPRERNKGSLLDDEDDDESQHDDVEAPTRSSVPGAAAYLEMEEEPPRSPANPGQSPQDSGRNISQYEPIKTSSGLLLTHRRTPTERKPMSRFRDKRSSRGVSGEDEADAKKRLNTRSIFGSPSLKRSLYREKFELDRESNGQSGSVSWSRVRRLLSYVQVWVVLSAVTMIVGLAVIIKHVRHESSSSLESEPNISGADVVFEVTETVRVNAVDTQIQSPEHSNHAVGGPIVLLPLPVDSQRNAVFNDQQQLFLGNKHQQFTPPRRLSMTNLKHEFESWAAHHGKMYHSHEEKEKRFNIWMDNHHKIREKNRRHGPCKLTNKDVFGSNHLQDLTHEEFEQQYLTGYTGPTKDKERPNKSSGVLGPHIQPKRHPEIHRRLQEKWKNVVAPKRGAYGTDCEWWNVSCLLRHVFETYFYGLGLTLEPAYDSDSYPKAMDWRDMGAVNTVRAQGNCGACWAITAIETIESSIFIATGTMYDLSETEVIVCADECEMCAGGWPQEAVEYVMEHNGVPSLYDAPYDGDWLLSLSNAQAGESDGDLTEDDVDDYKSQTCSSGGGGNSKSGSQDEDENDSDSSTLERLGGEISGYGYATKKCVCYTDGSGCECNQQSESMAVRNIATYGPAVVCFDASTWKEYTGGIITSESGCSQGFMDVNHCAQVVGYAYDGDDDDDEEEGGSNDSKSNDQSKSGSGDEESNRVGYWIVRNQWSAYWGMSGYAYVAMGENTCGILNDMLIAYT